MLHQTANGYRVADACRLPAFAIDAVTETMAMNDRKKPFAGITSLEEVLRVTRVAQ